MIAMISFWLLIPYILTLELIISTLSLSTHSSHEVGFIVSASLISPKGAPRRMVKTSLYRCKMI
jgi:hypothetical protein